MKNKTINLVLALSLVMSLTFSCDKNSKEAQDRKNILKDYVKTPLDKADAVSKKVEDRNKKMLKQFDN